MAEIIELNEAAFDTVIETGVTLIDFWAPWCGPCKMLGALLEQQIAPQLEDEVKVCKLNVEESPELAARLEVLSIPVLMIYKDGILQNRLEGMQKLQDVLDAVREALG